MLITFASVIPDNFLIDNLAKMSYNSPTVNNKERKMSKALADFIVVVGVVFFLAMGTVVAMTSLAMLLFQTFFG
jgi:hypothetical protein